MLVVKSAANLMAGLMAAAMALHAHAAVPLVNDTAAVAAPVSEPVQLNLIALPTALQINPNPQGGSGDPLVSTIKIPASEGNNSSSIVPDPSQVQNNNTTTTTIAKLHSNVTSSTLIECRSPPEAQQPYVIIISPHAAYHNAEDLCRASDELMSFASVSPANRVAVAGIALSCLGPATQVWMRASHYQPPSPDLLQSPILPLPPPQAIAEECTALVIGATARNSTITTSSDCATPQPILCRLLNTVGAPYYAEPARQQR